MLLGARLLHGMKQTCFRSLSLRVALQVAGGRQVVGEVIAAIFSTDSYLHTDHLIEQLCNGAGKCEYGKYESTQSAYFAQF